MTMAKRYRGAVGLSSKLRKSNSSHGRYPFEYSDSQCLPPSTHLEGTTDVRHGNGAFVSIKPFVHAAIEFRLNSDPSLATPFAASKMADSLSDDTRTGVDDASKRSSFWRMLSFSRS